MSKTDFYPRSDKGVKTSAPYRRKVGQECELSGGAAFSIYAWEHGLGTPPRGGRIPTPGQWGSYGGEFLHGAHCTCDQGYQYPIHTTAETTGGEHVIGSPTGVLFASDAYMGAIAAVAECHKGSDNQTGGQGHGGHTHVMTSDLTTEQMVVFVRNLTVIWPHVEQIATGQWSQTRREGYKQIGFRLTVPQATVEDPLIFRCGVAEGCVHGCDRVRRSAVYGRGTPFTTDPFEVDPSDVTSICSNTNAFRMNHAGRDLGAGRRSGNTRATTEFRIWNTQTSRWRLYMAAGVSSALVEAAFQGRALEQGDTCTLEEHLDGLLTEDLKLLMARQRAIVKGDMSWAA